MNTAVINIRTDLKLKNAAQNLALELGFNLSSLLKAYLQNFVRTRTVHFSDISEKPSNYLIKLIKEAKSEQKKAKGYKFNKSSDALKF